jgi:hypothetical protein
MIERGDGLAMAADGYDPLRMKEPIVKGGKWVCVLLVDKPRKDQLV